ncbi:hypothetical protein [Pseudomonas sp. H3_C08]
MARRYYFAILPSTASNEVASASMESIFRGRNTLMAVLYFFVWAAVWAWVVQTRGAWNLILANLAGAASGFIVAMIFFGDLFEPFPGARFSFTGKSCQ